MLLRNIQYAADSDCIWITMKSATHPHRACTHFYLFVLGLSMNLTGTPAACLD